MGARTLEPWAKDLARTIARTNLPLKEIELYPLCIRTTIKQLRKEINDEETA